MATFEERASGYIQAKIRRKGHPPQSKTFRTKGEAEIWARKIESAMDQGEFKDARTASNTTLRELLEYYRDNNAETNKGKDIDLVRLNILLDSDMAKYSMSALGHDVIETWCSRYVKQHKVKGSTINRYLNLLSAAINVGIKKKKLGIDNPCKLVERLPEPQHRDRRLFGEEERRLLNALTVQTRPDGKQPASGQRNIWLRPIVEFALETGMRRSELLGLEWQYVDKANRIAHIPDTKIGKGEEAPVSRDVPLSTRALEILDSLPRRTTTSAEGESPVEVEHVNVFGTTTEAVKLGYARAVVRARKAYEADCKKANETPLARMLVDLHFHDLRHEATSRMAKMYDTKKLGVVGGWRDMNTLAKYYNPTIDELVEDLRRHEAKPKLSRMTDINLTIGRCRPDDFFALIQHSASGSILQDSKSFIESDIRGIPGNYDRLILTAEMDSLVVGFLYFYYMPELQQCHFAGIFVAEGYRRRGIATCLMEELASRCEANMWRQLRLNMNPLTKEKEGLWRSLCRIADKHPHIVVQKVGPAFSS